MDVTSTALPEVLLIRPKIFDDRRGFFTRAGTKVGT